MFQEKILAYKLKVNEETGEVYHGYFEEIENTLEAKQKYVGGYIQVIRLTDDIDVVLNDEGKLIEMKPCRVWTEGTRIIDLLVGNILCVRHDDEGNFISILQEDESIILRYLKPVTMVGDTCMIVPEFFCKEFKE